MSERRVSDADTAATLIETWTTTEEADLLGPHEHASTSSVPVVDGSASSSPTANWRVGTAAEAAAGTDGSRWYGGNATACGSFYGVCLGGRVRVARDSGSAGPAALYDQIQTTGELLGVAALPRSFGRLTFIPLIGIGGAWTNVSPQTGTNTVPAARHALCIEAAAGGAMEISRRWSVGLEIGGAVNGLATSSESMSGFSIRGPGVLIRAALGITWTP
jgi:hypothetical protein